MCCAYQDCIGTSFRFLNQSPKVRDFLKLTSTLLKCTSSVSDLDILLPNPLLRVYQRTRPMTDHPLEFIAPLCTDVFLENLIDDHSVLFLFWYVKSSYGWQNPDGYDVHRKIPLVSGISRRLFGADSCLPDAKEIRCSQMLQRICRTMLELNRKRINHLRCDYTKELLNSALREYLSTQGTVLKTFRAKTPGTAARNTRTVMSIMRSTLKGAGLPKNQWSEAITAAYNIKIYFQVQVS